MLKATDFTPHIGNVRTIRIAPVIAMLGDDPEDYMARSAVKWLIRLGVNVLTMSPGKKDYGHHNYPLERIEKAMAWLIIIYS